MERFMNFYNASLFEIDNLNRQYGYAVPNPRFVIFGHTHQPIPWGDPNAPKTSTGTGNGGNMVRLFNTGGWLMKKEDNVEKFVGAEVFAYTTKDGFRSVRIQ
jgi:hypothetical protein